MQLKRQTGYNESAIIGGEIKSTSDTLSDVLKPSEQETVVKYGVSKMKKKLSKVLKKMKFDEWYSAHDLECSVDILEKLYTKGFVLKTEHYYKRVEDMHPLQPVEEDDYGVIRFKQNKIVRYLVDTNKLDLNDLFIEFYGNKDDWSQLMQLIGYSVSGFMDIEHVSERVKEKVYKKYWSLTK